MLEASSLHVLIIGGGLGGLCLAQGLQQAGISVAVYERDATPVIRRQGYRIHIDARGADSLRACLPSHLFELFIATASAHTQQITIMNRHLRKLKVIDIDTDHPATFSAGVDRLTLRKILLAGLENVIFFGKDFSHYEQQTDGSIQAYFSDGTVAHGDILVAADGVNSRVRQQFLPAAALVDTATRCIYGKVALTETTLPLIPDDLNHGFTVIIGKKNSLSLGQIKFLHAPQEAAARLAPEIQFHTTSNYLMWSLNAQRGQFTASDEGLFRMDGIMLQQLVLKQTKRWHPKLRALIATSDPTEIFPIAVRVATPCAPWQSSTITFLGDAIHAMSPAGGSGANTALRDAHLLCETLISVAHHEKALTPALHEYEAQMLTYGFEAVRFSAQGGVLQ